MELTFRSVTSSDTDAVCALWASAGLGGGLATDRKEIAFRLRNNDGFFILAFRTEDPDTPVAVAMGCNDDHRGWLKRVAVAPTLQGNGIGEALITEVEHRFLDAGIEHLRLSVWSQNESAVAFWQTQGYEELPEIRYFVKRLDSDEP